MANRVFKLILIAFEIAPLISHIGNICGQMQRHGGCKTNILHRDWLNLTLE